MTRDAPVAPDNSGEQLAPLNRDRPASRTTLLLALGCGMVYLLVAGRLRCDFEQTPYVHHIYLAEALLHGQFHVTDAGIQHLRRRAAEYGDQAVARRRREERIDDQTARQMRARYIEQWWNDIGLHDWTIDNNRLYGYWGPLLPVATIPFVMLGGLDVSDRLISVVLGALNVGLFHWFLTRLDRSRLLTTTPGCRIGLTILLAFGTVHFWMTCAGPVWFSAQLVTLTALLAACGAIAAPANRPLDAMLAGVLFGAAMLGRNIVAVTGLFFVVLIWARTYDPDRGGLGRVYLFLQRLAVFAVPCLAAVGLQLAYNHARFGDVFESGQAQLIRETGHPRFVRDFNTYGQFHPHYFARNAWYYLFNWHVPVGQDGRWLYDPDGNSMFLITPPLVYALLSWRRRSWLVLAAAAGVLPFLAALLFFRATGWAQFGNRYLLEGLPLLLVLAAAGMRGCVNWFAYTLIAIAVAVNAWGTRVFLGDTFATVEPLLHWTVYPAGVALAFVLRPILTRDRRLLPATARAG